ncbi:hypothetical protein MMC30_005001 [Trapelia coarctata]|nr:hypothetical protein [Trapelia coarctata]
MYTHGNANQLQNPLAYLATSNNTSSPSQNPARPQPSPYADSDISFSTLASVSALSLTSTLNNYNTNQQFRPEESFGNVSRSSSVWSANNDFQQPTNSLRHGGAGQFWAPPDEIANARTNGWRRPSGSLGGAETVPPPSHAFSPPPPRVEEENWPDDGASTIKPWDSSFSRPRMDDGASFVSSASSASSSGLSRHSSSVASLRSLRARDSAPSDLFQTKPMSLAERIAANERRKRTQEMLKNLHEEEERKAQLAAIEEDELVLPRPQDENPVSRRASAASNRSTRQHQATPGPRIEQSPPTRNFPAVDEFPENEDLIQWNDDSHYDLQEPLQPDKGSHWNDLKDLGIVLENEEQKAEMSPSLAEEPARVTEPLTDQRPLPNLYELPNQWNEPLELQEIQAVRKPQPPPRPVAAKGHSQWNEPLELQHTKSTRAPKPPVRPLAAELPNQWNDPLELQNTGKSPPWPGTADLPNQWNEPVELQHVEPMKKPLKKAPRPPPKHRPAELPPTTIIATPELDSTTPQPPSVFELDGSIFADTDSIIHALPARNRTPSFNSLPHTEPAKPAPRGTTSWLSQAPQSNYFDPHALYAELPASDPAPLPYTPYTPQNPRNQPPAPHITHRASAPPPAPTPSNSAPRPPSCTAPASAPSMRSIAR